MAAGKGGGSWKVAYADFVTAMMAFFLVMWIGSQDQKVRQSVANYFVDPSGVAKKPSHPGAVLDAMTYGSVPEKEGTAMKGGRTTYDEPREFSPATKAVSDWIHADEKRLKYWRAQALRCRETAQRDAKGRSNPPEEIAAQELSTQLQVEIIAGIPPQNSGIYQDLIVRSVNDVNWKQLAEDLLRA